MLCGYLGFWEAGAVNRQYLRCTHLLVLDIYYVVISQYTQLLSLDKIVASHAYCIAKIHTVDILFLSLKILFYVSLITFRLFITTEKQCQGAIVT